MSTTAEESTIDEPATDPTIDVELPTATAEASAPTVEQPTAVSEQPTVTSVVPASRSAPRRSGSRRTKVTVRRFGLLSVFKFALIFSLCVMMVVWLALILIFFVLQAAGVTDTIAYWIGCVVQAPEGTKACVATGIDAFKLFTYLFFGALVMAGASAILWTFMALIYNLIADIVGGVEVVLAEKRT